MYTRIIHTYEIRRYAHIMHAYGFTLVLWFMIYLFLNKLREMEYLIQEVFALKIWFDLHI